MVFSIHVTGTKCNNPICIFQEMLSTMEAQCQCYVEVIIEGLITCRRSVTGREYSTEKNCVCINCTGFTVYASQSHFFATQPCIRAAQLHIHAAQPPSMQ